MIVMNVSVPTNAAATMPVALAGNVRKMNARDFECCNDDGCDEKQFTRTIYAYPLTYPANVLRRTFVMIIINAFAHIHAARTMIVTMAGCA